MFNLAQALLFGSGSGVGQFEWQGPAVLEAQSLLPNDSPQIRISLEPNGTANFWSRRNSALLVPWQTQVGRWLSVLVEDFGENVLVRAREGIANSYGVQWTNTNQWQSLNIEREYFLTNSLQPPATLEGSIIFEFAFASAPQTIVFSAEQSYYVFRNLHS